MLNVNEHIFEELSQDEFWLIVQLARFGQNIFPSNDLILKRCNWGFTKLKVIKRTLVKRQFITVQKRFKIDESGKSVRDSNEYVLKRETISQYIGETRNDKYKKELAEALEAAKVEISDLNEEVERLKKRIEELERAKTKPKAKSKAKAKPKSKLIKHESKVKGGNPYKIIEGVILYDELDFKGYDSKLKFVLLDWLKHKTTLPKYYTTKRGMQRIVNVIRELNDTHGAEIVEASIAYSIDNDWQDIYKDKVLTELKRDKDFKNKYNKEAPRTIKIG